MIRGFLAGSDEDKHSPGVQIWLKQLEEEVFKADNVLDELNYENLRRKVKYQNQLTKKKVFFCFSFFNKIGFRSRLASTIRGINTNLESIHQDAEGLGLTDKPQVEQAFATVATGATTSRQTDSKIVRSDVLGRDDDESKIVKKLLAESESDRISVISITGMGGLGKTTLAKAVFNTPQFDNHFDKKIWVCVAKPVGILDLFKMILESSTGKKAEVDNRQVIVDGIETELKEKRYLLVLDDLWNHQQRLLDDFFTTLKAFEAKKGSWCLVTTRLQEVATTLSGLPQINFTRHELGKLCNDDCWSIINKWVNVGEEVPENIRKQVLRRCDGLPLAATLIGGLLFEKRKEEWLSILKESLLNGDQGGIEQILKVSFDHLSPVPVKKCFAYCSIFDQDTRLEQDRLVELWMAEGFLQPDSQNERMMEKIGCEYLRILQQTSLLEEVKDEWRTWYKMHDLVHDFAKSILNQDRYLAVYSSERKVDTINAKKSASLRTLFLKGGIADDMLSKFKYLHILKLFGADAKKLPKSIGKLIHLHLLDISGSRIRTLPKSLCKLYSLQTLRIHMLEEGLPKKMSNLISLRHLHYNAYFGRHKMPSRIGRLTCLQTLEFFNIGRQEEGRGIQELGTLQDLKGSLEIRNLELVNGKDDAELANLSKKPNMYRLVFEWGNRDRESYRCDEDVLEGLQPHPNLKELQILKFMGDQFPQWFMNLTLTSLVELRVDCTRCRKLPALGQLPFLKRLYLTGLESTTFNGLSFYSTSAEEDGGSGGSSTTSRQTFFPALKILSLESMKNLEEWKDAHEMMSIAGEVRAFPELEKLYISECPKLTTIPTPSRFPSLDVLEIKKNCHVLLAEKVLSNIANFWSLKLIGGPYQRIWSLELVRRPESSLSIVSCNSLPADTLERLFLFPTLYQHVQLKDAANITTLRGMSCAACLKRLVVDGCENLRELPEDLYQFQALECLAIEGCPRIDSFGYPNPKNSFGQKSLLKSLKQFIVDRCDALTRLPVEMFESCTSLRELKLSWCDSLVSFPLDLRRTPSLESFWLFCCPNLIAEMPSGFGYLTSLREVRIGPFSDDSAVEFDWAGLASSSSLRDVSLVGMCDTESLPHQLQDLTTITSLSLEDFGAIGALPDWLGNLAPLDELTLSGCEKLEYLPSLAAMERLKLRRLELSFCPLLTKRCTLKAAPSGPRSLIFRSIIYLFRGTGLLPQVSVKQPKHCERLKSVLKAEHLIALFAFSNCNIRLWFPVIFEER